MWLDRDMAAGGAVGKRRRRQTFSDAAIQFCLSIKCLFGLALRQTLGAGGEPAAAGVGAGLAGAGLQHGVPTSEDAAGPDHLPSQRRAPQLLVDRGVKFLGEGEWKRWEARGRVPPRVAQGASGHRRADAGDPCGRGHEQCDWRRADAA